MSSEDKIFQKIVERSSYKFEGPEKIFWKGVTSNPPTIEATYERGEYQYQLIYTPSENALKIVDLDTGSAMLYSIPFLVRRLFMKIVLDNAKAGSKEVLEKVSKAFRA